MKLETQNLMQFFVAGKPYAQTRARHVQKGDRMVTYSSASKGLSKWRSDLKQEFKRGLSILGVSALEGALCVDMTFRLATKNAARHWTICHVKPDKDNLEKAVLDCMEKAGVFAVGDSQVWAGETVKVWVPEGFEGVLVRVARVRVANAPDTKKAPHGASSAPDWLA